MTKQELWNAHRRRPDVRGATVDFALPQDWLDNAVKAYARVVYGDDPPRTDARLYAYTQLVGGAVWIYRPGNVFGQPYPLTKEARRILKAIAPKEEDNGNHTARD